MARCKFCNKEITWTKEGRKNIPVNSDGGKHSCEEMQQSMKSIRTIDPSSISPEDIARYERAMNEKAAKK